MPQYDNYREYPFDREPEPKKTSYESDVLVVGGGYAGLCAAITASRAGMSVVLVDKGRPGFSGQSPHACCTRWFDKDMGDDPEVLEQLYLHDGQYIANRNWIRTWIEESKSIAELYSELGITEQYENANDTGYAARDDYFGYKQLVGDRLRHKKFLPGLIKNGVCVVERTMIYDVVEKDGRVIGAVGFDVPSGAAVTFSAKATILCMGTGIYKPVGYPAGGLSFDAVSIGYRHGLPIIGMEFEDTHNSLANAPDNGWLKDGFPYLQNMMLNGGEITRENVEQMHFEPFPIWTQAVEGLPPYDAESATSFHPPLFVNPHPGDVRNNRRDADEPKNAMGTVLGVAPGMSVHTTSGIYCGPDDTHGATGIPGLYCAGDGCNAGPVGGAAYTGHTGFTSNFFGVQGKRSGEAAVEYVKSSNLPLETIPESTAQAMLEAYTAPMRLERGCDVSWALDCLQGIMTPYWNAFVKSEERLKATLVNVLYLRDHVAPQVMAMDEHELRLCEEFKHKVLQAEMKLRVSLARKESRGTHFREDYPCRDDEIGLCYYACVRQDDGSMGVERIEIPEDWKGDLSLPYEKRYTYFFPGEEEAAKARGLMH